jgi:hypothetical protein
LHVVKTLAKKKQTEKGVMSQVSFHQNIEIYTSVSSTFNDVCIVLLIVIVFVAALRAQLLLQSIHPYCFELASL